MTDLAPIRVSGTPAQAATVRPDATPADIVTVSDVATTAVAAAPRSRRAPRARSTGRWTAAQLPQPPTDVEKYSYLDGPQGRALLIFQLVAFAGVVVSFGGFATSSYLNFVFLIPLVVLIVEQLLSTYTGTFRRLVTLPDHRATVELWEPSRYPSVDVYLTTMGEELDLLDNTMHHMARLDWPGRLNAYVLDDGDREPVRLLAERYGFHYLARPGSEFKKAGNLRYGYARSDGDFILILDADFAARPDLLTELMPYFDVPTVGIVQSPQYASANRHMGWVERAAGATQELFYRFIQPSRDHHGAAICVGAGALYRRSALDVIGGFPKISHSEDIYTGLELSRVGYRTQYVPVIVTKGLSPDNLDNFIAQQYRWCEGSMSMVFSRDFHLDENITLQARLSFWSGFLYYLGTAMYAFVAPLPAVIMAWFYPAWVRGPEILWLSGAVLLWLVIYPIVMHGKWRIEVLRIQTVYGFAHAFNIVHLLQGRLVGWHPTNAKAAAPLAVSVRRLYTWYLGIGQVALLAGLSWRIEGYGIGRFWGMTAFSLLNLYIFVPLIFGGLRSMYWRAAENRLNLRAVDAVGTIST